MYLKLIETQCLFDLLFEYIRKISEKVDQVLRAFSIPQSFSKIYPKLVKNLIFFWFSIINLNSTKVSMELPEPIFCSETEEPSCPSLRDWILSRWEWVRIGPSWWGAASPHRSLPPAWTSCRKFRNLQKYTIDHYSVESPKEILSPVAYFLQNCGISRWKWPR